METKELAADLRRMADELEAADALQTQDASRMMQANNAARIFEHYTNHAVEHEWSRPCDEVLRCVDVEPAPKAAASTSVDAPKCSMCRGRGGIPGMTLGQDGTWNCPKCHGTGKAPAEPVKPLRWIIESTEHGGRIDGHLRYSGNNWKLERYRVVRKLPTAPLDDAGLRDIAEEVLRIADGCSCPGHCIGCEVTLDLGKYRIAKLREYAAMGYPEVK